MSAKDLTTLLTWRCRSYSRIELRNLSRTRFRISQIQIRGCHGTTRIKQIRAQTSRGQELRTITTHGPKVRTRITPSLQAKMRSNLRVLSNHPAKACSRSQTQIHSQCRYRSQTQRSHRLRIHSRLNLRHNLQICLEDRVRMPPATRSQLQTNLQPSSSNLPSSKATLFSSLKPTPSNSLKPMPSNSHRTVHSSSLKPTHSSNKQTHSNINPRPHPSSQSQTTS